MKNYCFRINCPWNKSPGAINYIPCKVCGADGKDFAMIDKVKLPTDKQKRKEIPLATGCMDYFPDALAAVAELSRIGNEQHNPGKPLHWDRSKSTDEADCLMRHFLERGKFDIDGVRHTTKVAWRALALLQKELEASVSVTVGQSSGGDVPYEPGMK